MLVATVENSVFSFQALGGGSVFVQGEEIRCYDYSTDGSIEIFAGTGTITKISVVGPCRVMLTIRRYDDVEYHQWRMVHRILC